MAHLVRLLIAIFSGSIFVSQCHLLMRQLVRRGRQRLLCISALAIRTRLENRLLESFGFEPRFDLVICVSGVLFGPAQSSSCYTCGQKKALGSCFAVGK